MTFTPSTNRPTDNGAGNGAHAARSAATSTTCGWLAFTDQHERSPAEPPSDVPPPTAPPEPPRDDEHDDEHNGEHGDGSAEAASHTTDAAAAATAAAEAASLIPPFSPVRMRRQLFVDSMLHWLAVAAVLAGLFVFLSLTDEGGTMIHVLPIVLVLGGWVLLNMVSARVSRDLPMLSAMIAFDPALAERRLAEHMRRRPLMRWVRLMLYHRLALLRHRQQRFAEAAAICHIVLGHRLGPARDARPQLLLLLSEAAVECRDLVSAFGALTELHHTRLSLVEALQRFALQTRYELAAGYDDLALQRLPQKVQLAELMPAPQCGAVHAMLATAADRTHKADLARSLWSRVELLATPEQLERFRACDFGVSAVATLPLPQHDFDEANE